MFFKKPIQVTKQIGPGYSKKVGIGGIVIGTLSSHEQSAKIVIGVPGLPNLTKELCLGDAVLYETPIDGIFEIRAVKLEKSYGPYLLITRVSPRMGLTASFESNDKFNTQFFDDEISKIYGGLKLAGQNIAERTDITSAQLELINRKLDEIATASKRLGRKDWVMFVAGSLTNLCTTTALSPDVTAAVFHAVNQHLGWVFQNAIKLIH